MSKSTEKPKGKQFEQSLEELQKLVEALESGDLSLEDSMQAFEAGIKLTREAQQQLAAAEQRVLLLTDGEDGPVTRTFEDEQPG